MMSSSLADDSKKSTQATASTHVPVASANGDENLQIIGVPVVVTWSDPAEHDGILHHLSHTTHDHLTLSIHRDVRSITAFFQLRANVALKNKRDRTNVLLSIPPESIRTLALVEGDPGLEVATSRLGTSTRCLRFDLREPASLVVPKGDITPKHKASRVVLDSLRVLASSDAFSVYLPSARASNAHLMALCEAVTSGTLRSMDKFLDIASLYGGKGGRTMERESLGATSDLPLSGGPHSILRDQGDSPPSYDELSLESTSNRQFFVQSMSLKFPRSRFLASFVC